mgnify:CR=1 FL=1
MICAEYADPKLHKHSAAHIMISLDADMEVVIPGENIKCQGILIPSGVAHTANSHEKRVLVFLFDSTTAVSEQIDRVRVMTEESVSKIRKAFSDFENSDRQTVSYHAFVQCVFACNNIDANGSVITDERIQNALTYIDSRLQETITCADVAMHVFLSEGRFSHLFKEQVGMTFAAYLIYQRVVRTYTDVINGSSVTRAALSAGFSSSAHFAEVNKKMFGLSATAIKKELKFYKIAEI